MRAERRSSTARDYLRRASSQLLLAFAGLALAGAIVLRLPACHAGDSEVSFLDALFTATSAVCVTGLGVVDTGKDFSALGQAVILILIQLGGLGILTVSSLVLILFRERKLGLGGHSLLEASHGRLPQIEPGKLLFQMLVFTLAWEALGAAVLYARLVSDLPPGAALWHAVFHSVSAFCNAGFSLYSDSLTRYRGDLVVNFAIIGLIVVGGIGFAVVSDISRVLFRRRRAGLTLHTRTVIFFTGLLIAGGTTAILILEWRNALAGLGLKDRVLAALFLSVSTRTAGFNTLDTASLCNPTLLLIILLMFIGASPGSTGGGIKTTTAAVLLGMLASKIRGRPHVELRQRRIPNELVQKALAVTTAFCLLVAAGAMLLEVFEFGGVAYSATSRQFFLDHLFEVVSAICTVGLSTGTTAGFSAASKIVLIACMFIGRLGPVVIAESLIGARKTAPYEYPEEPLLVG
jgi:trk system potassium uptake protein TrkH